MTAARGHDAQKALSDLRDHLARHDKPIAFLFGAGTSCAVRVDKGNEKTSPLIPAVGDLTVLCRAAAEKLGNEFFVAWQSIEQHCADAKLATNVESILSRVRMMLSAIGKEDKLCGLGRDDLGRLEAAIRKTIAETVTPDLTTIGAKFPHRLLARWLVKTSRTHPVEIFTMNYDVLLEHALEQERVPTFDGFVGGYQPFFHPDSLRRPETAPGANWTRLWKMHGSVTWRRAQVDGRHRVVRGAPDREGEMILPSFQKYDESRQQPYAAFTDRLSRFLEQDDALLVVCGFSFGDEHINNLIFAALEHRPRTHVFALQFEEPDEQSDLCRRGSQRRNMIVVGPKTGIIGGRRAPWAPIEGTVFSAEMIELEAAADGEEAGVPIVKVGDFNCFCGLLEAMTSGS